MLCQPHREALLVASRRERLRLRQRETEPLDQRDQLSIRETANLAAVLDSELLRERLALPPLQFFLLNLEAVPVFREARRGGVQERVRVGQEFHTAARKHLVRVALAEE